MSSITVLPRKLHATDSLQHSRYSNPKIHEKAVFTAKDNRKRGRIVSLKNFLPSAKTIFNLNYNFFL